MKKLTISTKVIFALFAVLFSVNLWGQGTKDDTIDLEYCTIEGVDNYYIYTGSEITITPVVKDDEDKVVPTSYYSVTYVYNDGNACVNVVNKGKYTLKIVGNGTNAVNSIKKDFFINSSNSFPSPQDGSSSHPFIISNEEDWITLAYKVYIGSNESYYYELGGDVTIGAIDEGGNITRNGLMIGDADKWFCGDLDGNDHTLTFYYDAPISVSFIAPFYSTSATIHDLTINGKIKSSYGSVAGLMYSNYDHTIVQNVTIGMDIDASAATYCGGFDICGYYTDFVDCIYNGIINAGSNSGGFSGSYDPGSATFNNCIFDPADGSSISDGKTFGIVDDEDDITNCCYTALAGTTAQGRLAYVYESIPDNTFVKKVTAHDITVYGKIDISGIEGSYLFNGSDYYPVIKSAVTLDGNDITSSDTTFTITKNETIVNEVVEKGSYTLTIAGNNANYPKSFNYTFDIVEDLTGGGTSENPFHIRSSADWLIFSNHVNNGDTYTDSEKTEHPYSEAYYRLTNDITTSEMVGTQEHPFSGDFSGRIGNTYGAYTLTFNKGTRENPLEEQIIAPFRYTDGATIHSLIVGGAIHTNAGKEAGLIGVNTYSHTSRVTTVEYIINYMNLYCYEELWDAQGGGLAYDGSYVEFSYSSHEGIVSASNYHGGICGIANSSTTFTRCLFDPAEGSMFWAENFAYDHPTNPDLNYSTCYYTVGFNQEESEQGVRVFVNDVPEGSIGHKITTFHEKQIYVSVPVVISGANKRYIYNNGEELLNISDVGVTINEIDAIANNLCSKVITNSSSDVVTSVRDKGTYTLTITAPKEDVVSDYKGTVTQLIRVVDPSSTDWTALQAQLSAQAATITIGLSKNITAGPEDPCLVIESGKTVTINMNGYTINRGFYNGNGNWETPVVGGHVMKIASGATVIINGGTGGTITGGCNKGSSNTEHAENSDGGGIYNMGSLTLNNVTIQGNYCEKYSTGISRTARGGGIYSGKGSTLIINNCVITHNEAQGGGGGLFAEKAAVFMMTNTTVQSNSSLDKGGGIRLDANGTKHLEGNTQVANALISGCTIENNTVELHTQESASNGGGIHHDDGTLDLVNCTIQRNNSSKYGGGIYIMKGTINATNCNISYNRSYDSSNKFEGYGGGICLLGGSVKLIGGTITGNSSYKENGGGVFVAAGKTLTIEGALSITENWTYDDASLSERHITNVYLVGTSDKIRISGSIEGSNIGVSKNGTTGQFTKGLEDNGTIANFSSDNADYQILPYTDTSVTPSKSEAKIDKPATWDNPTPVNDKITITEPTYINTIVTVDNAYTIEFSGDGCLIIGSNGILTAKIDNNDPLKLIINDGGQVITTSTVKARVKKEILAFSATEPIDNWYLISSPISSPVITTATNLITLQTDWDDPTTPSYDLYRFNEATTETNAQGQLLQWENYRSTSPIHTGFSVGSDASALENGRGYLYRNYYDYTLNFDGTLTVGNVTNYTLTNTGTNVLKGFNVIGNPYPHNIKKGGGQAIPNTYLEDKYYVLNPTGCQWVLTNDGTIIPPFAGIMVQASSEVTSTQTLTISDIVATASKGGIEENNNIWFTVSNSNFEDKACVEFRKGHGLNKISHLNEEAPMLYIHHDDEDFASVDMNPDTKAFDLNFEAKTMGRYTLSVKPQGEFGYLHLIDKVTGEDVDMLLEKEYSFIGMPSDSKDRFVVRLSEAATNDNGNVIFAYQSGDDIVVSGEGELRVFDIMGRLVAQKHVNGVETMCTSSLQTGVYIFRLNEVSQKIVVK